MQSSGEHSNLHSIAARVIIIASSVWTAGLQLFSSSSLAYRAAGPGVVIDLVNVAVLCISALALADVVWHDTMRRGLLWPSFPCRLRHRICIWVYTSLAAAFAVRAFVATGDPAAAFQVGGYYVLISAGIIIEAAAIAHEHRQEPPCHISSSKD
jgi:hypothetical protein